MVRLKYEEKTYDVEYKGKFYTVIVVSDWERGEFETVVQTPFGKAVTPKMKEAVTYYFEKNREE